MCARMCRIRASSSQRTAIVAFSSCNDWSGASTTSVNGGGRPPGCLLREKDALHAGCRQRTLSEFRREYALEPERAGMVARRSAEPLVEIFLEAESVAVALDREVIASLRERLQVQSRCCRCRSPARRRRDGFRAQWPQPLAWPPLDSKKMAVATLRCRRAFLIVSCASASSRVACESRLPQMSVVTAPSSLVSPNCSNTADRNMASSRGAVPRPINGSLWPL